MTSCFGLFHRFMWLTIISLVSGGKFLRSFKCLFFSLKFSGRIHSAVVSGINTTTRSVTVEWFERGETKGKEVTCNSILLISHLINLQRLDWWHHYVMFNWIKGKLHMITFEFCIQIKCQLKIVLFVCCYFKIELDAILALNPDLIPAQPTENVRTLPSKLPAPVRTRLSDLFDRNCTVWNLVKLNDFIIIIFYFLP